jgi:phosphatidate cytidylyltransferase
MKRLATALVLVPVVVWVVLFAPDWALLAAVAIVGLLAFQEFDHIAAENEIPRPGWPGVAAGLVLMLAPEPLIVAVLVALAGMLIALRVPDLRLAMAASSAFVLGVLYIFGAWRCAIELHALNRHWLMFALLLSWAGDTAAMYAGKAFGRHPLAPRVSPSKTWEGAIASVIGGVLAGFLYARYFLPSAPIGLVLPLAAAGNIAGQVGDLAESAMKRGAGVKDSGSSLPGHGGWLDRIDSTLFAVPVVYALLKFLTLVI